jgi:hypothetical protein
MDDLISRSALLKDGIRAEHGLNEDGILYIPLRDVTRSIENAPAVEAEPVVHAHWVWDPKRSPDPWCSACVTTACTKHLYCHHCGAKMDGRKTDV